jgi:Gluconate 2-dehydrogenase subunit 3
MSNQTRRDWVLTIGQAAAALAIPSRVYADTPAEVPLPPGVYLPSADHLGHALMSADRFHSISPGCPTDYIRPTNTPFSPLFFSAAEFPVVLRLTQLLLDDISDAGVSQEVAEWFDLYVSSADGVRQAELNLSSLHRALATAFYGSAAQHHIAKPSPATTSQDGIKWILDAAQTQHSSEFMTLDAEQQKVILRSISDEVVPKQLENPGTRFFALLKAETIRGFYTSRAGLQELNFRGNAFYARSPGCNSR